MAFAFRKVYADLVTPDATVAVVYLGWARFLGRWFPRCGVEIYRPDGTRTLLHGAGPPPVPADLLAEDVPLRVRIAGGAIAEMRVETVHGAWDPEEPCPDPAIRWRVLAARTRATLTLPGGETLEGQGYVDWVELGRGPRAMGLETLTWGRMHLPGRTVIVESLDFADGARWRLSRAWPDGADTTGAFEIDAEGRGKAISGTLVLPLEPDRVLHADDAFDPERIPGFVDRLVTRCLSGTTAERRWVGRAGDGHAVWERVVFA
jgi:hypothetical protein